MKGIVNVVRRIRKARLNDVYIVVKQVKLDEYAKGVNEIETEKWGRVWFHFFIFVFAIYFEIWLNGCGSKSALFRRDFW